MSQDTDRSRTRAEPLPGGEVQRAGASTAAERWLARLAWLLALTAVSVLVVGALSRPGVLAIAVAGVAVSLAALWGFLSSRGAVRWLAAAIAVAVPLGVIVLFLAVHRVWEIVVVVLLGAASVAAAWAALARGGSPDRMPEESVPPAAHPFLIMNPRSGGGKVGRFGLVQKAERLGARVALLEGPGEVDVVELARTAVADGADLLGVAGGDGTQALVAGVAAEHGLPFVVVSAGTRNHFAMDLGLDREHPDRSLEALTDGVEVRLDLGRINGRPFVNNASFGAYAEVVQSPAYRGDKAGTTLEMLPDLLAGHRGPRLRVSTDGEREIEAPTALLVSNGPYGTGDPAGLGRRPRIDGGLLGVVAVTVHNAAQAASLLAGRRGPGLSRFPAREVVVSADVPEIPVGVDGEALLLGTPVRCTLEPGALRVRLPRERPGVTVARPPLDPGQLARLAFTVGGGRRRAG